MHFFLLVFQLVFAILHFNWFVDVTGITRGKCFQVPGAEGNFVCIKDIVYKKLDISMLPFPTYFAPKDENKEELEPLVADLEEMDPFMAID
ncbi:hypothetical protein LOK49_LG02G02463 [Camellia lanceoleosa]|uniref:Uncharacterized protein n=1 Tax=Camellia lanceoleosa TaxID=1840588 RepID=A0ACC0IIN9_9ERIC|nr:hypothetical protein LOK49_LG02G02463 [Camellia lanceoleosa]